MYTEQFFRSRKEFHINLDIHLYTYLPTRLQCLTYEVGSGIVMVLLDSIDPESLKHFRAMTGSYINI